MNISTTVQQHYRREKVLSIDQSINTVREKFIQLSNTDMICGHLVNPFTSRYKLRVRCDQDGIYVDGLYGINMMPLVTKITLQPSSSRNETILNLVSQLSIEYINKSLIDIFFIALVLYAMTLLLLCDISTAMFVLVMSQIFSWLHFRYASKIVLGFLHRELGAIELPNSIK
jgi:hypothetical protein